MCIFAHYYIWTNALKLSVNYSTVDRGTGGRSEGNRHCRRHVCGENKIIETLSRVRGACPRTKLNTNIVCNKIRSSIVNLFRMKKLDVYEEIYCQPWRIWKRKTEKLVSLLYMCIRKEPGVCLRSYNKHKKPMLELGMNTSMWKNGRFMFHVYPTC